MQDEREEAEAADEARTEPSPARADASEADAIEQTQTLGDERAADDGSTVEDAPEADALEQRQGAGADRDDDDRR
jgi:hypothetical protein